MDAMRGHGSCSGQGPNVGVRAECLRALLCDDGDTDNDFARQMAGAQWIVDDLFAEVRGIRLQLVEFCRAMSKSVK